MDTTRDRVLEVRRLLHLPTPCPDCADVARREYCDRCVQKIAEYFGVTKAYARVTYGRKRGRDR